VVFHEYVSIRKSLRAQQGTHESRRSFAEVTLATTTMQAVQDSWNDWVPEMQVVVGAGFFWELLNEPNFNTKGYCSLYSRSSQLLIMTIIRYVAE
jgi:hypothetical protein